MANFNINSLIAEAQSSNVPQVIANYAGGQKFSFGIVYSKNNGKRISLSKSLAKALNVDHKDSKIMLLPVPGQNVLLLSSELPTNVASSCCLSGEDKKIGYASEIVKLLMDVFNLDFSDKTSMSFADIQLDTTGAAPVAIVKMSNVAGQAAS